MVGDADLFVMGGRKLEKSKMTLFSLLENFSRLKFIEANRETSGGGWG